MTDTVSVRFAGDSGDGMQLLGQQFTYSAADKGWQVQTLPDFPAEIRAPQGTIAGVSGIQVTLSDDPIYVSDDLVDVLVILNPAALKTSLPFLKVSGVLFINEDNFKTKDLKKAGFDVSPLEDGSLDPYQIITVPLTTQTLEVLKDSALPHSKRKKAKNFYVLGMVLWLFQLETKLALSFIERKFAALKAINQANQLALKSGFNFAMTLELSHFKSLTTLSPQNKNTTLRHINGVKAITHALATYAVKSQTTLLLSGYPITPASSILHEATKLSDFGISLFQAEDEIAAVCASMGAAFAGKLAVTCTSGPGLDLKAEGLGLAVMTELPLVVIDVQRAGPSTGLPTKTEQTDLNLALYGRHGEAPLPIIAPRSASDCFYAMIEAMQIAIQYMTPVIMLCDAYLANAQELWSPPDLEDLDIHAPQFNTSTAPYSRNKEGVRSWILPGTPDSQHCIGGLEKKGERGGVTYDPVDHQKMVNLREHKINQVKLNSAFDYLPSGENDTLIISWGSTYGAVLASVDHLNKNHQAVSMLHLRQLYPLPERLGSIINQYKKVLVAELNQGQLCALLRSTYLVDAKSIAQTSGQAFTIETLTQRVKEAI